LSSADKGGSTDADVALFKVKNFKDFSKITVYSHGQRGGGLDPVQTGGKVDFMQISLITAFRCSFLAKPHSCLQFIEFFKNVSISVHSVCSSY